MQECSEDAFVEKTKSLLLKIREIRQDTGYSGDQVLMAMLVSAIQMTTEPIKWDFEKEHWDPNFVCKTE